MLFKLFFEDLGYLTEKEWKDYINYYLIKISMTKVGKLLLAELDKYMARGYIIEIINYDRTKNNQYPCMKKVKDRYYQVVIPDKPYIIKVNVLRNNEMCLEDFHRERDKSMTKFQFQPYSIILAHELIHVIRDMKGINNDNEEEDTIYGLYNYLEINNKMITENEIRKEMKLLPRVNHEACEVFIEGLDRFYKERTKFTKEYCKKLLLF